MPDPELAERPRRRRFTAEYKLGVLRGAEACTRKGEIGAMLRREGLYTSHLTAWRKQRDAGALEGLAPRKRGPRGPRPEQVENEQLRRRAERAEAELDTARRVIEVQGNVSAPARPLHSPTARYAAGRRDQGGPLFNRQNWPTFRPALTHGRR